MSVTEMQGLSTWDDYIRIAQDKISNCDSQIGFATAQKATFLSLIEKFKKWRDDGSPCPEVKSTMSEIESVRTALPQPELAHDAQ